MIIPLKCILANHHIGMDSACSICHQGPKDISNLLFQCPAAREIWDSLNLTSIIDKEMLEDREGSAIIESLLHREDNTLQGFENIRPKELISVPC
jgi:hypothetical protein